MILTPNAKQLLMIQFYETTQATNTTTVHQTHFVLTIKEKLNLNCFVILMASDNVQHFELLGSWTLSIVQYSKVHAVTEIGSTRVLRRGQAIQVSWT